MSIEITTNLFFAIAVSMHLFHKRMLVDNVFNDKYNFELSSGATISLRELYYVDLKFTGGTNSLKLSSL